jgi:hypothetical protein
VASNICQALGEDSSFDASFDAASCATAAYGDLGLSSPWEKVFHGRGFLVAVGRVSGMLGKRAVVVGRLASAGGASLGGGGSRVHFVALVLAGPEQQVRTPTCFPCFRHFSDECEHVSWKT